MNAHAESKDQFEGHKETMRGRHESAQANHERRKNELTTELINKKSEALARKRLRKQIKAEALQANERISGRDREKIINDIPENIRQQLGRVILYEEAARRDAQKAVRSEHRANSRQETAYRKAKGTLDLIFSIQNPKSYEICPSDKIRLKTTQFLH